LRCLNNESKSVESCVAFRPARSTLLNANRAYVSTLILGFIALCWDGLFSLWLSE
jgi:hypothetical protein